MEETSNVIDLSSNHTYRTELPNIIFDMGLNPYEFYLYCYFKKIAGDSGKCWASMKTIQKDLNFSSKTIVRSYKLLIEKKLIILTQRKKEDGSFLTNLVTINDLWPKNYKYFLDKKEQAECSKCEQGGGDSRSGRGGDSRSGRGGDSRTHKEDLIIEEDLNKKNRKQDEPADGSFLKTKEKFLQIREKVQLTEKQYIALKKEFSEEDLNWIFDKLNTWKIERNQYVKSDYLAIRRWVIDAFKNKVSCQEFTEKTKQKNIKVVKELMETLESRQIQGLLTSDGTNVSAFGKTCSMTNPKLPEITASWYGLTWEND